MANRTIQQKIRKLKRHRRFARFSGSTTKHAVRVEVAIEHISEDKARIKEILVPVGPIHLSKHVVNTGRGPNNERMQQYYAAVKAKSFEKEIPIRTNVRMERWLKQYDKVITETPRQNHFNILSTKYICLDLFFKQVEKIWFFVEIDYQEQTIKRSRDYGSKETALDRLKNGRLAWIEELSVPSLAPPEGV